ncbi:hypothetical protein SLEP1_g60008 [Rubroshorea leprosula]|uniref:Uncharacterized protein n=1 Tax=Rubroshorea leprosula TaxID=152421 RepID=A0AAV5MY53_9ROSI|nr:hypothetical protein SLEP1_g60008 [Rubroshorea leprosula]
MSPCLPKTLTLSRIKVLDRRLIRRKLILKSATVGKEIAKDPEKPKRRLVQFVFGDSVLLDENKAKQRQLSGNRTKTILINQSMVKLILIKSISE